MLFTHFPVTNSDKKLVAVSPSLNRYEIVETALVASIDSRSPE